MIRREEKRNSFRSGHRKEVARKHTGGPWRGVGFLRRATCLRSGEGQRAKDGGLTDVAVRDIGHGRAASYIFSNHAYSFSQLLSIALKGPTPLHLDSLPFHHTPPEMLAALLLLARKPTYSAALTPALALAQFSGPPMQCLASCMDLADVYAKCAPLASEQAAFADCVKPLCSVRASSFHTDSRARTAPTWRSASSVPPTRTASPSTPTGPALTRCARPLVSTWPLPVPAVVRAPPLRQSFRLLLASPSPLSYSSVRRRQGCKVTFPF